MLLMKATIATAAVITVGMAPQVTRPAMAASAVQLRLALSSLGDLKPYRTIAADTLKIVDTGNLPVAKTRIKDLETAWDDAEAGMKPKDRTAWSVIDKSIDAALNALRSDAPKQADCAATLKALIAKIDDLSKA